MTQNVADLMQGLSGQEIAVEADSLIKGRFWIQRSP
jgi:hypothetical protein